MFDKFNAKVDVGPVKVMGPGPFNVHDGCHGGVAKPGEFGKWEE